MFRRTLRTNLYLLAGFAVAVPLRARNVAYRQRNLASDVRTAEFADHIDPLLEGSWGIAAMPQRFFGCEQQKRTRCDRTCSEAERPALHL